MSDASDTPAPSPDEKTDAPEGGRQTEGLQKALEAERKKRQAMEKRLEALTAAQRQREEEAAAKRGEFEQLYTTQKATLEALQAERDALVGEKTARLERIAAQNKTRLEALPEGFRALVPEGLDPEATAAQIQKLEGVLSDDTPRGGFPKRPGPPGAPEKIPAEAIAEAERLGYTDHRRFFEKIYKPRMDRQKG